MAFCNSFVFFQPHTTHWLWIATTRMDLSCIYCVIYALIKSPYHRQNNHLRCLAWLLFFFFFSTSFSNNTKTHGRAGRAELIIVIINALELRSLMSYFSDFSCAHHQRAKSYHENHFFFFLLGGIVEVFSQVYLDQHHHSWVRREQVLSAVCWLARERERW